MIRVPKTGRQPANARGRRRAAGWTKRAGKCDPRYRRSRTEGEENLLTISFALLSAGLALGALLLSGQARRVAPVHGLLGLAGAIAVAVAVFRGALPGGYGVVVLGLLLSALCGGVLLWRGWRAGLVVFLHVMAGGVAYLLLIGAVFG